jgi:hypothetical protein
LQQRILMDTVCSFQMCFFLGSPYDIGYFWDHKMYSTHFVCGAPRHTVKIWRERISKASVCP